MAAHCGLIRESTLSNWAKTPPPPFKGGHPQRVTLQASLEGGLEGVGGGKGGGEGGGGGRGGRREGKALKGYP